jgi:hypothetical protein
MAVGIVDLTFYGRRERAVQSELNHFMDDGVITIVHIHNKAGSEAPQKKPQRLPLNG